MESKNFLFQVVLSDSKGNELLFSPYFIEELDCELLLDNLISSFDVTNYNCDLNCVIPISAGTNVEYTCKYIVNCAFSDNLYLGIVKHTNCVLHGNI